jgi:hypothetical protein
VRNFILLNLIYHSVVAVFIAKRFFESVATVLYGSATLVIECSLSIIATSCSLLQLYERGATSVCVVVGAIQYAIL